MNLQEERMTKAAPAREERSEMHWNRVYREQREAVRHDVSRLARKLDHIDFEDLEQDTWIKVWRNIHKWDGRSFKNWVMRIMQRTFLDRKRTMRCRPTTEHFSAPEAAGGMELEFRDESFDLERDAISRDGVMRLRRLLGELTFEQRMTAELAIFEELPYEDVSQIMSQKFERPIGVGTVRSRVFRVKAQLRELAVREKIELN